MQILQKVEIITKSAAETKKLGQLLASEIVGSRTSDKRALVISLEGDLGAGKTTFTQGFAEGLGIREKIQSPTYVILKIYKITSPTSPISLVRRGGKKRYVSLSSVGEVKSSGKVKNLIHVDAYRVGLKDFAVLGWKDFVKNPQNIILVEWGNKIKKILPKGTLHILFAHQKGDERKIKIAQ